MAGVTEKKIQYVAVTGINFKDGKRERRVEPGDDIPPDLASRDIQDLLAIQAIKPKEKGGDQS